VTSLVWCNITEWSLCNLWLFSDYLFSLICIRCRLEQQKSLSVTVYIIIFYSSHVRVLPKLPLLKFIWTISVDRSCQLSPNMTTYTIYSLFSINLLQNYFFLIFFELASFCGVFYSHLICFKTIYTLCRLWLCFAS